MASKLIHEQDGQATIESTKSHLPVEARQQDHFNRQFYEVDKHHTSVAPTSIETGKYGKLDSDDLDNKHSFLARKPLLQVKHRIMQKI